jgi:hypothetical protein
MSTRRRRSTAQQRLPAPRTAPKARTPAALSRQGFSQLAGRARALDDCVGAICLIEVTARSLEAQDIACPEQEALKRAMRVIWGVHDWVYVLRPGDPDDEDPDSES